ncbi:flagellar hook-length control protein, partial [Bradyrhizobium guangdongense]
MVSVTSDVASSVPVPSTPSKSAKSQQPKAAGDQFGALVDSNTDAATSTQPPDPAPRRSDAAKGASDKTNADKSSRDTSAADQTSQAKSNDQADDAASADKTAAADTDKGPAKDKVKDKPETAETKSATKSGESKSEPTDETDALAAALQAADTAQQQAAVQTTPDPTAVIVPVPVAPTDPAATGAQVNTATDSPLTIAAAGIAASASTAAQIAAPATAKTDATTATTDTTAKTADADAAAAKAALADAAASGTADSAPTDPQTSGALVAAVDKATPKTGFKEAVTAQSNKDVSDITGDKDSAKPAGLTATSASSAATA